jgi:hypothetical protein
LPFSSASAAVNWSRGRTRTALPRCAATSAGTLPGAMNHSAVPSAWAITYDSATGVRSTSDPRTLSSQATESSALITAASSFSLRSHSATSPRLSALERPASVSSWTNAGAAEGSGWSCHTASTGLAATGTSSAPTSASALRTDLAQPAVCSHGSNPIREPSREFSASQCPILSCGTDLYS